MFSTKFSFEWRKLNKSRSWENIKTRNFKIKEKIYTQNTNYKQLLLFNQKQAKMLKKWFLVTANNSNIYIQVICTNCKRNYFIISLDKQLKTVFTLSRQRATFFMSTRYCNSILRCGKYWCTGVYTIRIVFTLRSYRATNVSDIVTRTNARCFFVLFSLIKNLVCKNFGLRLEQIEHKNLKISLSSWWEFYTVESRSNGFQGTNKFYLL